MKLSAPLVYWAYEGAALLGAQAKSWALQGNETLLRLWAD